VLFDTNPRFRDWGPMYRVARRPMARLTGRPIDELDRAFAELGPLHAQLRAEAGALPSAGALMQAPLLYVIVRVLRPQRLIETGISSGYSARLILEALERNGGGHLDSIGVDVFALRTGRGSAPSPLEGRHVGWLVPERLKSRWDLHIGRSDELLPALVPAGRRDLDLFLHDSLHQYPTMHWEYATAAPALTPGAILASHDVHANAAWPDFLRESGLSSDVELDHDLGAVRMPDRAPDARAGL
jgi:Methyltransferase domain